MIILHTTSLNFGGSEGNAVSLLRGFSGLGLDCILVVDHSPYANIESLRAQGLHVVTMDCTSGQSSGEYIAKFKKLLKSKRAGLVHSHIWERKDEAFQAVREIDIPHVVTLHHTVRGTMLHRLGISRHPITYFRYRHQLREYDPIVVNISDRSQWAFKQILPEVTSSRRVYLGVESQPEISKPDTRGNQPNVLWIGSMIDLKKPLRAIQLWERFVRKASGARLRMIGDGPLMSQVRARAAEVSGVEILGQLSPWTKVGLDSQILLHTSVAEGTPTVVLEGMALGLPVVCTDAGATSEIVVHRKTGFVSAPGDQGTLLSNLLHLAAHPDLRLQCGLAGLKRATDEFSIKGHISNILAVYADLAHFPVNRRSDLPAQVDRFS